MIKVVAYIPLNHYLNGQHSMGKEVRLNTHSIPKTINVQDQDSVSNCLNGSHSTGKEIGPNAHSIPITTRIQDQDSANHCLNGSHPVVNEAGLNVHSIPTTIRIQDKDNVSNFLNGLDASYRKGSEDQCLFHTYKGWDQNSSNNCLNESHPMGKEAWLSTHYIPTLARIQDYDRVFHHLNGILPVAK